MEDSSTPQTPLGANTAQSNTAPQVVQVVTPASNPSSVMSSLASFYRDNRIFIFAILAGIIIISLLGYYAFKPAPVVPTETQVTLAIDAPEVSPSGEELIYKVRVENHDRVTLSGMKLTMVYPYGMTYVSSSPEAGNLSGTLFNLPNISPNQNAVVIIKAKIQGNINDEKKLHAELHYKYGDLSAEFTETADGTIRLSASDVNLEVEGPASTNNSQLVVYTLNYKNNSSKEVSNARIQATYPTGFVFASSAPVPDLSSSIWNIGRLAAGQEGKITVQGTYKAAQPGSSATLTVALLVLDQSGSYYAQAQTQFTTTISSLPLLVTQELNQSGEETGIVKPGDRLTYVVRYQNNATVSARGVNIVLTIDSKAIDLNSIRAEGAQVNNNTIIWNASSVPQLENLNPSEQGSVQFDVEVNNPAVKDTSRNVDIKTAVKIKSQEYDTYLPGNDLAIKVSTQASMQRSLEYVSGSLPPKVGTNTSYRVSISLRNTTNDIVDGSVTAFIPLPSGGFNTSSIDNKESGNIQFDPSTGKLTWNVGRIVANTGVFSPARKLTFTVNINPATSQSGSEVLLVKDISWIGKDMFTDEAIKIKADNITTASLSGDNYYNGQVVQ